MKYQWESLENPVKIHFEIKLQIEIGNRYWKFNWKFKWTFEIQ